jgi:hypothetical protein
MQSHYPEQFVRDMGCTEPEWLTWLQAALPDHPWHQAQGQARVQLDDAQGVLHLQWQTLPPRQIALMRIPRLQVAFRFEGVSDEARTRFMRRFDLMTQRGGG